MNEIKYPIPNPEARQPSEIAFLFDVDGVITNPKVKKVTELRIIDHITDILKKKNIVAFNTGRSTNWAINNVFPLMLDSGKNHPGIFDNFFYCRRTRRSLSGICWGSMATL